MEKRTKLRQKQCLSRTRKSHRVFASRLSPARPLRRASKRNSRKTEIDAPRISYAASVCENSTSYLFDRDLLFCDLRFDFNERIFAKLPSAVVEPLLQWKRVLVDDTSGRIIPLGSDGKPICYQENEDVDANKEQDSLSEELSNDRSKSIKRFRADYSSQTEAAPVVCRKRSGEYLGNNSTRHSCNTKNTDLQQSYTNPLESGAEVFAVYFGVYYPATILSAHGHDGYTVQFLNDGVTKHVPLEGVVPLNLVAADQECFVEKGIGVVTRTPSNFSSGLFAVSLSDEDDSPGRTVYVRWYGLSFPLRTWRKELSRRLQQKMNVATSVDAIHSSLPNHVSTQKWRRTSLLETAPFVKEPSLSYPLWPIYPDPDPESKTMVRLNKRSHPVAVSAILKICSSPLKEPDRCFLITLDGHPWHYQYRVPRRSLSNQDLGRCFERREIMIEEMGNTLKQRDPESFQEQYAHYGQRMNFKYLPRSTVSRQLHRQMQKFSAKLRCRYPTKSEGCSCQRGKCELGQCPCLVFKEKGAVMICGQACGCSDSCPSSYLKEERQVPLVLFHTRYKGWGVLTPVPILAGTFLGLYAGHIVDVELEMLPDNTYIFDMNQQVEKQSRKYAVDGTWSGNISRHHPTNLRCCRFQVEYSHTGWETTERFFNHSCVDPTLVAKVLFTRGNLVTHDLAFFAARDIRIGEELTFCYSAEIMQQRSSGITCRCTSGCKSKI